MLFYYKVLPEKGDLVKAAVCSFR